MRHGYFKHRTKHWAALDEQIYSGTMKADHIRRLAGDLKTKLFDVKGRCSLRVLGLDQDIGAKGIRHDERNLKRT